MSVKKKLLIVVFVMAVVIFVAGQIAVDKIEKNFQSLKNDPVEEVDLARISDGTYPGSYEVFPVAVELSVEVENHRIIKVDILKHQNGQGEPAEDLADIMVEEQRIAVDDVTGATYSSLVIKKAVASALK